MDAPSNSFCEVTVGPGVCVEYLPTVIVGRREFTSVPQARGAVCQIEGGEVLINDDLVELRPGLLRLRRRWQYRGSRTEQVRLMNRFGTSTFYSHLDYYTYAGNMWNGNRFGVPEHTLGEHKREERFCVPSCITLEARGIVLGVWTLPQRNSEDLVSSGALSVDHVSRRHVIEIALPFRDEVALRDLYDDQRLILTDGLELQRDFYLFASAVPDLPGDIDGHKNGYSLVLDAAWDTLAPNAPTKPEMSLSELYEVKLAALMRTPNEGLLRTYRCNGRDYTIHYVAKHLDETGEVLHPYSGFSWSGHQGLVAYNLMHSSSDQGGMAHEYGRSAIDFFLDHGRTPCGLLYPVFFPADSDFPWPDTGNTPAWGTYLNNVGQVDMYPLGEGLYWILRASRLAPEEGPSWIRAVTEICDRIMALWPNADIPARVDGETAETVLPSAGQDGFTNASYLMWPLCELSTLTQDQRYVDYAAHLGEHILAFALRHEIYWKSEPDAHCIDKRAGFGPMRGFLLLYQATGEARWLGAAVRASNWMKSWQWAYNVHFAADTPLGHYDYRTAGGTSTRTDHDTLQYAYAALAQGWCLLWEYTGDRQLLERARALLHQGTQFVLTQERIDWLNQHYFARIQISRADFVGAHTENVVQVPVKQIGRRRNQKGWLQIPMNGAPFYAVFGLAMPLEWCDIQDRYGSVVWSARWRNGEALDTVRLIRGLQDDQGVTLAVENMLTGPVTCIIRVLHAPLGPYYLDEQPLDVPDLSVGWSVTLGPNEQVECRVEWPVQP